MMVVDIPVTKKAAAVHCQRLIRAEDLRVRSLAQGLANSLDYITREYSLDLPRALEASPLFSKIRHAKYQNNLFSDFGHHCDWLHPGISQNGLAAFHRRGFHRDRMQANS